jgi:hypothetical protein
MKNETISNQRTLLDELKNLINGILEEALLKIIELNREESKEFDSEDEDSHL